MRFTLLVVESASPVPMPSLIPTVMARIQSMAAQDVNAKVRRGKHRQRSPRLSRAADRRCVTGRRLRIGCSVQLMNDATRTGEIDLGAKTHGYRCTVAPGG